MFAHHVTSLDSTRSHLSGPDVTQLDVTQTLAAVARLHALKLATETELLRHALHYADLCPGPAAVPAGVSIPGAEQSKVYGGPGCPGIGDLAPAEFGALTQRSPAAAARYLGQALALRHRLPRTWAQVLSGHAAAWKACTIATATTGLSLDAAAIVDARVCSIVDSVTPLRLANLVKAALWQADPDMARAEAEAKARERGVWPGSSDEHGTTTLFVRAATGDVIRLDATITQIADALAAHGDTGTLDQRRARAVGVLADPELTGKLLTVSHHLLTTHNPTTVTTTAPAVRTDGTAATAASSHAGTAATRTASSPAGTASAGAVRTTTGEVTGLAGIQPEPPDEPDMAQQPATVDRPGTVRAATEPPDPPRAPDPPSDVPVLLASLTATLAGLRDSTASSGGTGEPRPPRPPRARTMLYVHLSEQALAAGEGVARVEGYGPVITSRLAELLGHDQVTVRPVIDLNTTHSVDAYEIPHRIREHVKLRYPVEQFPYGPTTTTTSTDLDHLTPYDPVGPPGQTSTTNLAPLGRHSHRVKTFGGWTVRRLNAHTIEWTTRHGFKLLVDHTGTHPRHSTSDDAGQHSPTDLGQGSRHEPTTSSTSPRPVA